ncbi:MAG TPA: hypothetical protein VFL27_02185 [Candidatus Dormibacteraeota bacterium]|nr:hypothetical protein [Candidatus Dormibacteraeota bacterium]
MATLARPAPAHAPSILPRVIITGFVALVVGVLLGVGVTLSAVGLLSFAVGGTLTCSANPDGTVTSCTNDSGQQVKVPHHIRIRQ